MKKVSNFILVTFVALVLSACVTLEETRSVDKVQEAAAFAPEKIVVADFDSGMKPNNLGGDFGSWDKDPDDESQFCEAEFIPEGSGYSMKLVYDVDSEQPAFNGFWMKFGDTDFSPYSFLNFSLKGDLEDGFTNKIVIELKNSIGETGKALVSLTGEWQEKSLPFSVFSSLKDYSSISEVVIVFDDQNSQPKTGAIYIDDIYVTK